MKYFIKIQSRFHIILLTKSLYECHAYPNSYKYLQISLSKYLSQWFLSSHFPHGHSRGNENIIHLGPEILACAHFLGLPLPSYMSLPQSPCLCKPVFSPTKGEELYPLHSIFVSCCCCFFLFVVDFVIHWNETAMGDRDGEHMWDILKDYILVSVSYTLALVNLAGLFSEGGVSVSRLVGSNSLWLHEL